MSISTAKDPFNTTGSAPVTEEDTAKKFDDASEKDDDENRLNVPPKEKVEQVIKESDSLITALESVAAMYSIPSSHIIVDDSLKGIQVNGDMISAPDRPNPSANTKAIVCAIGAVLDNISQRIDEKLNNYQASQCKTNMAIANQKQADPSKGEVVGRFFDRDGGEIIAYSSGLVDMDNTPAAREKVDELRNTKQIPEIQMQPTAVSDCGNANCSTPYFTAEDDVMNGVDTEPLQFKLNDIPSAIHESAELVDLYTKLGDSTTMGYDLMKLCGFDYVKPIHAVVQEGDESAAKDASTGGIRHMRFDNKNLFEAIRLFNEALTEAMPAVDENTKKVKVRDVMRTKQWKDGIRRVEDQFDCRLSVKYHDANEQEGSANAYTIIDYNEWRPKLKISKSKGFQLGGMNISITFVGRIMNMFIEKRDKSLFGQSVMSVMLHEIHHNIVQMLRQYDDEFIASMSSMMMIASSLNSAKARRQVITRYVNSLTSFDGKKLGAFGKAKMIRELLAISAFQFNKNEVATLKRKIQESSDAGEKEIKQWLAKIEKLLAEQDRIMKRNATKGGRILHVLFIVLAIVTLPTLIGTMIFGTLALDWSVTPEKFEKWMKEYLSHPDKEEFYCDLFAGIYQVPISWLFGQDFTKGYRANDLSKETLKKLVDLEGELNKRMFSIYPSDQERAYAGYLIAKKMLENKDLTKEAKDYAQWIVDNYSNLDEMGIREKHNSASFNPAEADDLDAHIQRIIDNGTVTVTEQSLR